MRRTIGACEKLHGAVIDHVGHENTRVFKEVAALGKELEVLGDQTLGSTSGAKVAILFDWDNWWSIEYSAGPSQELKYQDEVLNYYTALHNKNVSVDIIGVEDDLSKYDLVIAPILYMTKGNYDQKIREFVSNGGTFVTTFFSGIVDKHDLVITGGYPGRLRDILGIWVEEMDALPNGAENHFIIGEKRYPAKLVCDIIHLENAKSLSHYETDFYANSPVVTVNEFGKGKAYYMGTRSNEAFYDLLIEKICKEIQIEPVLVTPKDVEAVRRTKDNADYIFILNHSDESKTITFNKVYQELLENKTYEKNQQVEIAAKDVIILKGEIR